MPKCVQITFRLLTVVMAAAGIALSVVSVFVKLFSTTKKNDSGITGGDVKLQDAVGNAMDCDGLLQATLGMCGAAAIVSFVSLFLALVQFFTDMVKYVLMFTIFGASACAAAAFSIAYVKYNVDSCEFTHENTNFEVGPGLYLPAIAAGVTLIGSFSQALA